MPTNRELINVTLATLRAFDGHSVSEESLGSHIETRYGGKLTTAAIRDALVTVRDAGWAHSWDDRIEGTLWAITEEGKRRG
jgi:hypothetical protein